MSDKSPTTSHKGRDKEESLQSPRKSNTDHLKRDSSMMGLLSLKKSFSKLRSGGKSPEKTSPSESPSRAKSPRGSSANLKGERSSHNRSSGNLKPSAESSRKCSPSQAGDAKLQRGVLPSYGRRSGQGNSGAETPKQKNDWFTSDEARPKDRVVKNLERVSDGVDEDVNEKKDRERKHRESLLNKVSEAPTDYYPTMPQLADLNITNTWNKLLESIHQEFDMSCLTACLATELDEDIPWNPEMVLVQLTSDMLDAAELKADGTMSSALDADDNTIGSMQGGEVTRKRKEKDVSGQGSTEGKDKKHGGRSPGAQDKANENRRGSRNDSRASGSRGNRNHDISGAQGNRRSPSRHGSRKSVKHSFRGREE